jgi:hypothetical protein
VQHECSSEYAAYHHSGDRRPASIRYVVMHSTEGPTAEAAARYFEQPSSGGSSNLVLDDNTCFRVLGDHVIPWGAPPLNTLGFHVEQAGYASWSREEWLRHSRTVQRAAYKAALRCKWYRIPPVLLDVENLRKDFGDAPVAGVPAHPGPLRGGIVTHATVSDAYHESDHTDPGPGWPADTFVELVRGYLKQGV